LLTINFHQSSEVVFVNTVGQVVTTVIMVCPPGLVKVMLLVGAFTDVVCTCTSGFGPSGVTKRSNGVQKDCPGIV